MFWPSPEEAVEVVEVSKTRRSASKDRFSERINYNCLTTENDLEVPETVAILEVIDDQYLGMVSVYCIDDDIMRVPSVTSSIARQAQHHLRHMWNRNEDPR